MGIFISCSTSQHIRIDQLSDSLGNTQEFSASEINLYSDKYIEEESTVDVSKIKSSELTIDNEIYKG